uniref:Mitochondrial import inner membrane translocase subunit TIM50 n=1 Tax=Trypanosoma congolense (strain IL3000) TaxID=1068625 RepID=F9W8H1_TRYCI|nr:unnamed protein product [Trypanosoma congolense IL3000]
MLTSRPDGSSRVGTACPMLHRFSTSCRSFPRTSLERPATGSSTSKRSAYRGASCIAMTNRTNASSMPPNGSMYRRGVFQRASSSDFVRKFDTFSPSSSSLPRQSNDAWHREAASVLQAFQRRSSQQSVDRLPVPRADRSLVKDFGESSFLIPSQSLDDVGKLVVVLDLDETLVYSREGAIVPRPGTERLLDVLRDRCEVIVWTAGEQSYAMDVINLIDQKNCIKHCIFRSRRWWSEKPGCVKDLACLGRPLDRTLIIDNTSDCMKANPRNGLLVTDFRGLGNMGTIIDTTLYVIADVIDDVLNSPNPSIGSFRTHPQLQRRVAWCEVGSPIEVLTLKQDRCERFKRPQRSLHLSRPWRDLLL